MMLRRKPDQPRSEMWSIVVEITAEECGHEQRNDRDRLAKARQFLLKSEVGLIVTKTVHGQIRALDAHHRGDLRRDTVLPRQPLAKHDRLANEDDRRSCGIDRLIETAHPIAGGI